MRTIEGVSEEPRDLREWVELSKVQIGYLKRTGVTIERNMQIDTAVSGSRRFESARLAELFNVCGQIPSRIRVGFLKNGANTVCRGE